MSLPSSHILSPQGFRHIGFMVLFMTIMANFCALGFISVQNITQLWLSDIENTLNVEIPSYDSVNKILLDDKEISDNKKTIETLLRNDPIIKSFDMTQPDSFSLSDHHNMIPAPTFITIHFIDDLAQNAEHRIIEDMTDTMPSIIIRKSTDWENDIQQMGQTLKSVFGGLALSVFIVTSIILAAVIKTQITANQKTIDLVYLMGAKINIIVKLFQKSILRPVIWGVIVGIIFSALGLFPLIEILNIDLIHNFHFLYGVGIIAVIFITLALVITRLVVMMSLRRLP